MVSYLPPLVLALPNTMPSHFRLFLPIAAFVLIATALTFGQAKTVSSPERPTNASAKSRPAETADAADPADLKTINQADEAIIIERLVTRAKWDSDGTGTRETTAIMRVQSEAGVQGLAVLSFPYTSENETVEMDYVRVRKSDGTVVNTPSYNIQDMPADVTRVAPMYSDIHEKHVTVKGLGVGDTLEYVVRYRATKPEVAGHFWFEYSFEKDAVAKDEQLQIDIPQDKFVKVVTPDLQPHVTEEAGRRIYTWKTSNLQRKEKGPRQMPRREGPQPSVQITTFRSWEQVGQWYVDLQRPQLELTPQIRAKAAEITKGLASDDEKIKALYRYVATRFHYISLSFGIGRYQPHPATDVLENEYGDCKDKHTLLAALLKAAGYDAWPVAINSNRKINPELPSPGQFNHVITVVPRGDSLLWLDSTPEVAPFGLLMASIRDKQALVIPTDKPASLVKTPANPPFASSQTFVAEGKLGTDGTFVGHIQRRSRGDLELILRLAFRATSQSQWKELAQRLSYGANFAGEVSAVTATKPEDTDVPFDLSYDYTRKEYSDWKNRRITPPMPPFGIESGLPDEKKPEEPYLLGAPGEVVYRAKVELPAGYTAVAPKDLTLVQPYAEYHATYSVEKGVLTAARRFIIKQSEVPLSAWDDFKTFRRALTDDEDHFIDLSGGDKDVAKSAGDASDSSEAGRKFREGVDAMQRGDKLAAADAFHRVLEINPKYRGVHFNLALLALVTGAPTPDSAPLRQERAIQEMLKEQEISPEDARTYQFLAAGWRRKEPEKAMEQWRKLLTIDPKDRFAITNLTQMLTQAGKYSEALTVLEQALKESPDSLEIKDLLAGVYLRANQKDKGVALLKERVAADQSPETLNSISYTLAEVDSELPLAREYAERAVRQLQATSVQNGDSERLGLATTRRLYMTWDTLGWVYFKMGELEKAARYLRASWEVSQDAVPGDHLAQTYERQNKKAEAARIYKLALAASRAPNEEIQDRYQHLTGRKPEMYSINRRPDGTWTPTPGEELSRMRTVTFTAAGKHSGSATYSVVLAPDQVESVKFVGGDDSLKGLESHLAAAKIKMAFPDVGPVKIVRRGIVTCTGNACTFVLLRPADAATGE